MARLTYQNVDAPNFSGATNSLAVSNEMFGGAMKDLQGLIAKREMQGAEGVNREVLARALKYTDDNALGAALNDGSLLQGLDPRQVSPETFSTLMGRQKSLIGNEGDRITNTGNQIINTGRGINNEAGQFGLDRARVGAGREDEVYGARPEANRILSDSMAMITSGIPDQIAQGRKNLNDNSAIISKAGYDVPSILSGSLANGEAGLNFQNNQYTAQKTLRDNINNETAYNRINHIMANTTDPQVAIRAVQEDKSLNPDQRKAAIGFIENLSPSNWAKPSAIEATLGRNLYGNQGVNGQQQQAPAGASHISYANQNATRNKPIDDKLVGATSFLQGMGIRMEVYSGGQDGKGEGDKRTGSVRHDHGGAGDVHLIDERTNRKLSEDNPQDIPILQSIFQQMRQNGVTGIGAGKDYMGADKFHVGFGKEGTWGKDGKGANAPAWLKAALDGVPAGAPGGAMPQPGATNVPRGTNANQSLTDPMQFLNQAFGGQVPRMTPTTPIPETPSMQRSAPTEEAPKTQPVTPQGVGAGSPMAAATGANANAMGALEGMLANSGQTDNSKMPGINEYVKTAVDNNTLSPAPNVREGAARLQEQQQLDATYERQRYLNDQIANRPDRGQNASATVKQLLEDLPGVPIGNIQDAFNKLTTDGGMGEGTKGISNDIAAALIRESTGNKDLRGPLRQANESGWNPSQILTSWLPVSDEYGNVKEGTRANRVDMDKLSSNLKTYQMPPQKPGDAPGLNTSSMSQQRNNDSAAAQLQQLTQTRDAVQQEFNQRIQVAQLNGATPEQLQMLAEQYQEAMMTLNEQMEAINAQGNKFPYRR